MSTEDVIYTIDARNLAVKKFQDSQKQAKEFVGEVKEMGTQSKASAELVGTLGTQVGNAGFGSAAGEVGQLIERMSAFSDVAANGGEGALLFKAGIAAAAGVIAFKLGNAIGDSIFQTEQWQKTFERAVDRITEDSGRLNSELSRSFGTTLELAQTISSEFYRNESLEKMFTLAGKEAEGAAANVEGLRKTLAEMEDDSFMWFQTGNHKALIELQKKQLANAEAIRDTRRSQKQQLEDMLSPAAKQLKLAKERLAAEQKSDDVIASLRRQYSLAKATGEERLRLALRFQGVKAKDMEMAVTLQQQTDKIAAQEKQRQQAEADAQKSRLQREKEIAKAKEQFAKESAKRETEFQKKQLAAVQSRIQALQSMAGTSSIGGPNVATNQRFGTGAVSARFQKTAEAIEAEKQTKFMKEVAKLTKIQNAILKKLKMPVVNKLGN